MRALGAVVFLLAQLRPVLGVVLCTVAGSGDADCGRSGSAPVAHHRGAGVSVIAEVDAGADEGCSLTDICRPLVPTPLVGSPGLSAQWIAAPLPQLPPASWRDPFGLAPPTPPPNS